MTYDATEGSYDIQEVCPSPHPVPKAPFFADSGMANDSRYQPCSPYSNRSSSSQR